MSQWTRLADLAQRASAGVFGESATLTIGGTAHTVKGEFDAAAVREESFSDGVVVSEQPPRLSVRREQFDDAAITPGTDTAQVRSVTYTIHEARPDGAGSVVLILRR